jgi:hypothetical protein
MFAQNNHRLGCMRVERVRCDNSDNTPEIRLDLKARMRGEASVPKMRIRL